LQLWRSLATSNIGTNPIRLYQRRPKWPGWILLRLKRVSGKRLVMRLASLTTKGLDKSDLGVLHPTNYQSDDRKIHNLSDNDKLFVLRSYPAPVAPVPPPLCGPNVADLGSRLRLAIVCGRNIKSLNWTGNSTHSLKWYLHSTQVLCHRVLEATLEH
jgi:hypothetical protein